ncbi:hypothetical protein ACMFMF_000548 [Clarireedia jacksonii]
MEHSTLGFDFPTNYSNRGRKEEKEDGGSDSGKLIKSATSDLMDGIDAAVVNLGSPREGGRMAGLAYSWVNLDAVGMGTATKLYWVTVVLGIDSDGVEILRGNIATKYCLVIGHHTKYNREDDLAGGLVEEKVVLSIFHFYGLE